MVKTMGSDYCPVARRPTIDDLEAGYFRAKGGVWMWHPPVTVMVRMHWTIRHDPTVPMLGKAICCLALLLAGCTPPAPPAKPDLRPFIATSGMMALMAPSPAPLPPAPTPGAKCPQCGGTGVLGDGKVGFPCTACNGTGVVQAASLPVSSAGVPADGGESPTFRVVCEDGVCRRIKIAQPTSTK